MIFEDAILYWINAVKSIQVLFSFNQQKNHTTAYKVEHTEKNQAANDRGKYSLLINSLVYVVLNTWWEIHNCFVWRRRFIDLLLIMKKKHFHKSNEYIEVNVVMMTHTYSEIGQKKNCFRHHYNILSQQHQMLIYDSTLVSREMFIDDMLVDVLFPIEKETIELFIF